MLGLYFNNIVFSFGTLYLKILDNRYEEIYTLLENSNEKNCIGIVISDAKEKDYSYSYDIEVQHIEGMNLKGKVKLILNIKKGKTEHKKLKYGDKIKIVINYEKPSVARNYKGFNYQLYLRSRKIYGTLNQTEESIKIIENKKVSFINNKIYTFKQFMKEKIKKILPNETAGLCMGMLIGDVTEIDKELEEEFRKSNLSHILAVSGSNVSYIIVSITYIFNKTNINKKIVRLLSIICLILFMILTGCTASVNRACIMAMLIILSKMFFRKSDVYNNLSISALILLTINPYIILDAGFQLSFAGTIGIVFLYSKIEKNIKVENKVWKYILNMLLVTLCANIAIIPILMFNFNTLSLTFFISNVLVGPILGIVVILGFVMFFISIIFPIIAELIGIIINIMLNFIIQVAKITSNLPLSQITVITPSIYFISMFYSIPIFIIYKEKILSKIKLFKIACILMILILIFNIFLTNIDRKLKIHFIDVGQGDSCLIITPSHKKILLDGGGSELESGFDIGEKILVPYLLDRKINKLDYVIISHFDSDHIKGTLTVLENLKVENVIIGKQFEYSENYIKFLNIIENKKIKVYSVSSGKRINIECKLYLDILWPCLDNIINNNILNNNSMVCKLIYKNFSMLFTGDIEEIAEKAILEKYTDNNILEANVLKVAHHGSKTSSTIDFLKTVSPKISLIGVGEDNSFGHPSKSTINNLNALNCKIYRTDKNGEITITSNGENIKIEKFIND